VSTLEGAYQDILGSFFNINGKEIRIPITELMMGIN